MPPVPKSMGQAFHDCKGGVHATYISIAVTIACYWRASSKRRDFQLLLSQG